MHFRLPLLARGTAAALAAALAAVALALAPSARADEGMWTYDNPPLAQLKADYGFEPGREWLDHLRLSSVRFMSGGSGSFVSKDGLVMTNHHVGSESIAKLSTAERDLLKHGFSAAGRDAELRCPDLELNVLVEMVDVTARIVAAAAAAKDAAEANTLRKAAVAKLEKDESEASGKRCDVVTLYRGGEYWLYRYDRFTDIRLVFCPDKQAAFFGGDPDNFTFPRYDLDVSFFRVYVDGKPYQPKHWLAWNPAGCQEGDLVFVSGHPGSTSRLLTATQMEFQRAVAQPRSLKFMSELIAELHAFGKGSEENRRRAEDTLFGLENSYKARFGQLKGLNDPELMGRKRAEEAELRAKLKADPKALAEYDAAVAAIDGAYAKLAAFTERQYWSRLNGNSVGHALTLARAATELAKPNGERLAGFSDASLPGLKLRLFSTAPVYLDLDQLMLTATLRAAVRELGPDDPFVKAALQGKSADEVAKAALAGTTMADPAARKALFEGGAAALEASKDPLLALAKRVDPILRELQKRLEDEVSSVEAANGEAIARGRFRAFGKSKAPDATFTLRLSHGVVKGYEAGGTLVPWATTFWGLYERHAAFGGKYPFDVMPRWLERRDALDLSTPFNFVSTNDIIGGNSGSPVVGRDGRIVGIIFDGNIESLPAAYIYDERVARSVSVHSAGIVMALQKVYDAHDLVKELLGTPMAAGS